MNKSHISISMFSDVEAVIVKCQLLGILIRALLEQGVFQQIRGHHSGTMWAMGHREYRPFKSQPPIVVQKLLLLYEFVLSMFHLLMTNQLLCLSELGGVWATTLAQSTHAYPSTNYVPPKHVDKTDKGASIKGYLTLLKSTHICGTEQGV